MELACVASGRPSREGGPRCSSSTRFVLGSGCCKADQASLRTRPFLTRPACLSSGIPCALLSFVPGRLSWISAAAPVSTAFLRHAELSKSFRVVSVS